MEIVGENRSFSWSAFHAVHVSSPVKSAAKLTIFNNNIARQLYRGITDYDLKRKDRGYVSGPIMSVPRLDALVAVVVRCLLKKAKPEGHPEKEYSDGYTRKAETSTRQLIEKVREFVKYWSCNEITVEEDGLSGGERRDAVMGLSR